MPALPAEFGPLRAEFGHASSHSPMSAREVFKQVAVLGGRLLSVYDGTTEYAVGQPIRAPASEWLYACPSFDEAVAAPLPARSQLRLAPRAVLRCVAWGELVVGAHCNPRKLATEWLRPEEVLALPLGYTTLVRRPPSRGVGADFADVHALVYGNQRGVRLAAAAIARARRPPRPASARNSAAFREAVAVLRATAPLLDQGPQSRAAWTASDDDDGDWTPDTDERGINDEERWGYM